MDKQPYWEIETPVREHTDKLVVSYYKNTGRLQVGSYILIGGEVRFQKVVVLSREDLQKHPEAARLLLQAIAELAGVE